MEYSMLIKEKYNDKIKQFLETIIKYLKTGLYEKLQNLKKAEQIRFYFAFF